MHWSRLRCDVNPELNAPNTGELARLLPQTSQHFATSQSSRQAVGRLWFYATCSFLPRKTEQQVGQSFLETKTLIFH